MPGTLQALLIGRDPKRTIIRIAVIVAIAYVVFAHVLLVVRGSGISMLPTLHDGQLTVANRLQYAWSAPRRGDIVVIRMAGPQVVYVKRIVALPGERVHISGSTVYVDDRPLAEPYVVTGPDWELPEKQLGPADYFVIGDNRRMPIERHDLGVAHQDRILGKLLF